MSLTVIIIISIISDHHETRTHIIIMLPGPIATIFLDIGFGFFFSFKLNIRVGMYNIL